MYRYAEFLHPEAAVIRFVAAEQSGQAGADVKPTLFEHHGFKGSIARLTASTMRRQLEISTVICLRPQGVNL